MTLTTLESLINEINCYPNLKSVNCFDFTLPNSLLDKIVFNDDYYTRYLIYSNTNYAFLLIAWKKGQSTPFHNHPTNGCLFKVISGCLKETRILNSDTKSTVETMFDQSYQCLNYIDNEMAIHKIEAISDSISLHIYSPPEQALSKIYTDLRCD